MAITNEDNKVSYVASGSATYAIPFYFTDEEHIKLYVDDVEKDINTHYTVTGAGNSLGGTLTLVGAPYSAGEVVHITREIPYTQEDSLTEGGTNSAKANERRYDKLTMICQQLAEKISRAIKFPLTSSVDTQFTGTVVPNAMLVVSPAGDALVMGPSYLDYSITLDAKVTAAQAAQTGSETAKTGAETAKTGAETARTGAETAKTGADTAKAGADTAKAAADSAAAQALSYKNACQLALNSVGWQDTLPVSSNTVLDASYNGCMILVDCSSGNVQLTLPSISALDLAFPFSIGIKKSDSSGNSITVIRAGTDKIDGADSKTIGTSGSGAVFIPDADPSPDLWTTAEFGATAGNMTAEVFSGTGAQTVYTLSVAPGSKNNCDVYIEGIYQQKASFTLSGTTLTFTEAPPAGTSNIEVVTGTTLPVGTPADNTVSTAKIVDSSVTALKIADASVTEAKIATALATKLTAKYLKAEGNAGQSMTSDVTNLPYITVTDTFGSAWNGTQFTVPTTGLYSISLHMLFSAATSRVIDIYKGGTLYKRIGELVTNSNHHGQLVDFFTSGEVLSFRAGANGGTLTNGSGYHYLSIVKLSTL